MKNEKQENIVGFSFLIIIVTFNYLSPGYTDIFVFCSSEKLERL